MATLASPQSTQPVTRNEWARDTAREAVAHYHAWQKVLELEWFLAWLDEREPSATVIELGTARGGTFYALSRTASPDALLISVDKPTEPNGWEPTATYHQLRRLAQPEQQVHAIKGDTQDPDTIALAVEALDGRPVDLLFVDADHRLSGATSDYESYGPLVRAGGIVAFHDIHPVPPDPRPEYRVEVDQLWATLTGEKHEWFDESDPTWGGIGALVKPGAA